MKKSNYFVFLIIICILFSISTVSASDDESVLNAENDYQINIESDQDFDAIFESCDEELTKNSQPDNLNEGSEGESANFTQFHEGVEYSFTALDKAINQSGEELNLTHDYRFNESIDSYNLFNKDFGRIQIDINQPKFVINGNNHVIDGAGMGAMFYFENGGIEIAINNLTFKNFNQTVLSVDGNVILNNVNFTGFCSPNSDILSIYQSDMIVNGCNFHSNHAQNIINGRFSNITINNSNFSGNDNYGAAVKANRWQLIVCNSSFENFTYRNGAMIDFKGHRFELVDSRFINAYSNLSGGAIIAKYFPMNNDDSNPPYISTDPILIRDCAFTNLSCGNDGGAIYIDLDSGSHFIAKIMNILGSNFTDCNSKFGGAVAILGGTLNIEQSNFIDNSATFEGGAIYSSWTNLSI